MRRILFICFLFISSFGFSQVSGELKTDKRPIAKDISYVMEMKTTGILVFDIAVDRDGNVTSCEWNKSESTINSIRYAYEAKNRILMDLKFEKGNAFPTFHRGRVTISSYTIVN